MSANFKSAAARRDERERFNAFAEFKDLGRQTDGLGRVVSDDAVFDRDFGLHERAPFQKNGRKLDPAGQASYKSVAKKKRPARAVLVNS
jgi:hypothetical protein